MSQQIQPIRAGAVMYQVGTSSDGKSFPIGGPSPLDLAPGWQSWIRWGIINRTNSNGNFSLQVQPNGHAVKEVFIQGWRVGPDGMPQGNIIHYGSLPGCEVYIRLAANHAVAIYALVETAFGTAAVPVLAEKQDNNPLGYPVITIYILGTSAGPAMPGPATPTPTPGAPTSPTPTPAAPTRGLFGP